MHNSARKVTVKFRKKRYSNTGKSVIIKASVTEISVEGTLEALVKASRRTETEKDKETGRNWHIWN